MSYLELINKDLLNLIFSFLSVDELDIISELYDININYHKLTNIKINNIDKILLKYKRYFSGYRIFKYRDIYNLLYLEKVGNIPEIHNTLPHYEIGIDIRNFASINVDFIYYIKLYKKHNWITNIDWMYGEYLFFKIYETIHKINKNDINNIALIFTFRVDTIYEVITNSLQLLIYAYIYLNIKDIKHDKAKISYIIGDMSRSFSEYFEHEEYITQGIERKLAALLIDMSRQKLN